MFRGNRRKQPSVRLLAGIVGVLALGTIGGGAWYGLDWQATYQQESKRKAADYAERAADQERQSCIGSPAIEKANCVEKARTEYDLKSRDNQREYDDLVAQHKAALWASVMGMAALIGMALSLVGIVLVYRTFMETKRTNRIALKENARSTRRAVAAGQETHRALDIATRNADAASRLAEISERNANAQLRAYMSVSEAMIGESFDAAVYGYLSLRNDGATPALIKEIGLNRFVAAVPVLDPKGKGPQTERYWHFRPVLNHGNVEKVIWDHQVAVELTLARANPGKYAIFVYGHVLYDDVFGDSHVTNFAYRSKGGYLTALEPFVPCTDGNDAT